MAIANKFIHFNTKAGFLNKLSEYVTYDESANTYTVKEGKQTDWNMFKNYTCFIKDTSEIWTHEQFYDAPATSNPKPLGSNSAVGTSLKYAREDHVHMAPSTISGNAGSATKLQTARTISLTGDANGSTTFDGSKNVSITVGVNNDSHNHSAETISGVFESRVKWANSSTLPSKKGSDLSPIDTILIPTLGANRFAGITKGVTYEYSRDNGSTWTAYDSTTSANMTKKLFNDMPDGTSGDMLKVGNYKSGDTLTTSTSWQSRVTINFAQAGVYSLLRKFSIFFSTNYSQNCTVSIVGAKMATPTVYDTFIADETPIAGWSGWNTINCAPFTTATQSYHTNYISSIRITFKFNGISDATKGQVAEVYWIGAYGGVGWRTNSQMAKTNTPYIIHNQNEAEFKYYVKAPKLITNNGTASQVVLGTGDLKNISELTSISSTSSGSGFVSEVSASGNKVTVTKKALTANDIPNISASKLTSGTIDAARLPEIPIEKIPAAALERLFVVASEAAAMSASVQEGDVVQVTGNNNKMYFCISATATTFANKFKEFTAGTAASVPWSGITNKPSWISTNKPTYDGSEIKLTGYATNNIGSITANSTVNSAIAELDTYAISSITDESGLKDNNKYVMQSLETGHGSLSLYTNKGIIDTYADAIIPVNMHKDSDRVIETSDRILVFTTEGEVENGPMFNEDDTTYLDGFGQFTTPPDTKDYPTSLTWTNGTTAGPIGKLAGTNMTTVTFPAIPAASASNSGVITTGDQIIAGDKTLSGTTTLNNVIVNNTITANVIKSTNSHSWMTACNYGNGVINMNQTTEGLSSAVVFQTNTDNHFTLSATNNYLILGGYKGDERTFTSNTINGHDGGIGIIIDDNSEVTDFNGVYNAKWRFYGYNGNPQGNIKWSINQDGQFTGTSRYTKNYALTHKTVSTISTIEAGNSYYIPTEVGFTISTLSGFSESTPDAQIVTGAKITFTASNAMKIQGLADISGNWFVYNLTYMPNGKVAISGAGFTN